MLDHDVKMLLREHCRGVSWELCDTNLLWPDLGYLNGLTPLLAEEIGLASVALEANNEPAVQLVRR